MTKFLGVDIGNSGIRISHLDVERHQIDATRRVSWLPPGVLPSTSAVVSASGQISSADDSSTSFGCQSPQRFAPDDPTWLRTFADLLDSPEPTRWFISSVRRDACQVLCQRILQNAAHQTQVVAHSDLALNVAVDFPERVGIDRLLAAIAAVKLAREQSVEPSLIVIQAGSAVTVDLVTARTGVERPVFEGGAILPGVPMMLRLLGRAAEQLPELDADDLIDLPPIPGKNTEAAMLCGAASALVGGVQHLIERYRETYGAHTTIILSGGDGTRIAPYLPEPLIVQAHLVQHGLLALALTELAN